LAFDQFLLIYNLTAQEQQKVELQDTHEQLISARVERDRSVHKLQQLGQATSGKANGKENALPELSPQGGPALPDQEAIGEVGFIRGYLDRIARLEKEIRRLKEVHRRISFSSEGSRPQARLLPLA
jgi:hypothetical protein